MNELVEFVQESNRIEGIQRGISDPQTRREIKAHERFLMLDKVTVRDIEDFVGVVQPDAALRRWAGQNV